MEKKDKTEKEGKVEEKTETPEVGKEKGEEETEI